MLRRHNRPPYNWIPIFSIAFLGAVVGIGAGALNYIENRFLASYGNSLVVLASEVGARVDDVLFERLKDVQVLAKTPVFLGQDRAAMAAYLQRTREAYPFYRWIGVTNAQGRIVVATTAATVGGDRSQTRWFQATSSNKGSYQSDVHDLEDSEGLEGIVFAAPILSHQGELVGVVTVQVDLAAFEKIFAQLAGRFQAQREHPAAIEYQLMSHDGIAFIDSYRLSRDAVNLKQLGVISALLSEAGSPGWVAEEHRRRHDPIVTGYAQIHGLQQLPTVRWSILLRSRERDILISARQTLRRIGTVGAAVLFPLLGLLLWTSRRLRTEWGRSQEAAVRLETMAIQHDRAMVATKTGEERFHLLFESAPNAMIMVNQAGAIEIVNAEVERLFGYAREELIGRSIEVLIPARYRHMHGTHVAKFFTALQARSMGAGRCLYGLRKDGVEFPIEVGLTPVVFPTGVIVLSSILDISRRIRLEQQLRQAEKLSTLGTLVAGVTHELHNPLFAISGSAELLARKIQASRAKAFDELADDVAGILEASQRAISLVDRWLGEARAAGTTDHEICQVNTVIERALQMFESKVGLRQVAVQVNVEADLPPVNGHHHDLIHVLLNLFLNSHYAIMHAHHQGTVTVTTRLSGTGTAPVVEICVGDDGPGIPAADLPRIFDPFFTTKPVSQGTGLGLWMCHRIVSELGGTITCESIEGRGVMFTLRLPASKKVDE